MTQAKELKPWDRRPWPTVGDQDIDVTYAAVGRALSAWERFEGILSLLFSAFVVNMEREGARRAYSAVRTFEGRIEMLKAASEAYFHESPNEAWLTSFKTMFKTSSQFGPRRNDIAHGVVQYFNVTSETELRAPGGGFALFPSFANFKDRSLSNHPDYCYTSVELKYFTDEFEKLQEAPTHLASNIIHLAAGKRGSPGKHLRPGPA